MRLVFDVTSLRRLAVGIVLGMLMYSLPAIAQTSAEQALGRTVRELETRIDARIGVLVRDPKSGWQWGYRQNERFLMASTFKSVLCGAVLDRADHGRLALSEPIAVRQQDILDYAPVARKHVGGTLTIAELCLAALDMSDNTAANLLIDRLGGVQEVTAFARRIGDEVTRLDRKEPDLNVFVAGDPRDTTSPAAMLRTWEAMLVGNALTPSSRAQLGEWMSLGGVTGTLIRAQTPRDWKVVDKSGGGKDHTRNLVAMITPRGREPFFVAIYISDTPADFATRNGAVAEIGGAVVEVLKARSGK